MNMQTDTDHLRLLSIFHYVVAALQGLFALFPMIHLVVGVSLVTGQFGPFSDAPPPQFLGWFFIVIASFAMTMGATLAICTALAGRNLSQQKHYTFCLVVAALECLFVPFGTILGVLTIIVLTKESVKARFHTGPSLKG